MEKVKIYFYSMENRKNLLESYSAVFLSPFGEKSADEYAKRRKKLLQKLDKPSFFAGVFEAPGEEETFFSTWNSIIQDPAFLFLTGINQPGCFLFLDPFSETEPEILFVKKKDKEKEFWTGLHLGIEGDASEVSRVTGFSTVKASENFDEFVETICKKNAGGKIGVYFSGKMVENSETIEKMPKKKREHNLLFASHIKTLAKPFGIEIQSIAPIHFEEQLVLDEKRISLLKVAEEISGEAFREILGQMKNFRTERDLSLSLNYAMQRRSLGDLSFPTIAASGKNACCLHYVKNDEALLSGDLVLLDFGVRKGTLCSDISRTIPVSGRFTPLQKEVYSIVLEANRYYETLVFPGKTLRELDALLWEFLNARLEEKLTLRGGGFELLYEKRPHGVSHFIGEEVHEASLLGREFLDTPLREGMVISNEPGVYGRFFLTIDGVRTEEILGIRIEDDLLLTRDSCINLSKKIPKEPSEIEALMNG